MALFSLFVAKKAQNASRKEWLALPQKVYVCRKLEQLVPDVAEMSRLAPSFATAKPVEDQLQVISLTS